jgi:hypothetical protein
MASSTAAMVVATLVPLTGESRALSKSRVLVMRSAQLGMTVD